MAQFDYLWEGGPEFAQSTHFRFGTDAVLLGNYMNLTGAKKAIDLGCASGVIALLMLSGTVAALTKKYFSENMLKGK